MRPARTILIMQLSNSRVIFSSYLPKTGTVISNCSQQAFHDIDMSFCICYSYYIFITEGNSCKNELSWQSKKETAKRQLVSFLQYIL